jgi:long-chain acyl-CoA synthetase
MSEEHHVEVPAPEETTTTTPQITEATEEPTPVQPTEQKPQEIVKQEEIVQIESTPDEQKVKTEVKPPTALTAIPTKTSDERLYPSVNEQSIDIGGCVRRRAKYTDALVMRRFEDVQTCYQSFKRAAEKFADKSCLGVRTLDAKGEAGPFVYETYKQVYAKVKNLAAGLRKLGVQPQQHIGLYSKNRPEWQISAEASHLQSMVTIALYDTLGEDSSLYIMNHGEIVALVCSGEVLPKVIGFAPQCQYLKHVILMDKPTEKDKEQFSKLNVKFWEFNEVLELGKQNPIDDIPPEPDSLCTIMYTSGTTGMPKGVMITHRNFIAAATGVQLSIFPLVPGEDGILSFLPLAHIFERVAECIFLQSGGYIAFWQGDIKLISNDIQASRPTVLAAVPRVLDRMYDKIKSTIEATTGLKKFLVDKALIAKKDAIKRGGHTPIWDLLVFNKFKTGTGGRLRGIISGGAPLRPEVQDFLRTCFDVPICQGYGLTETTAAGTIQLPFDLSYGTIGAPLPCNEMKLVDVPELNYLTTNDPPTGEVWIRGPNISLGYFKEPKKTAEVFDADGWFHTGDVGRINKNGTFSIIDRIKNIFKLAQGEYVAAENLEILLGQSDYISQIWIYGNSLKAHLIAVCVLEPNAAKALAQQKGIQGELPDLCKNPEINKAVLEALTKKGKAVKIKPYEFPKRIHLCDKEFALLDAVTPSMKLKRNVLQQIFQQDIDRMYAEIDEEEKKSKK